MPFERGIRGERQIVDVEHLIKFVVHAPALEDAPAEGAEQHDVRGVGRDGEQHAPKRPAQNGERYEEANEEDECGGDHGVFARINRAT